MERLTMFLDEASEPKKKTKKKKTGGSKKRKEPDDEVCDSLEEPAPKKKAMKYVNKQRVLLVGSRGITARQRHLMEDLGKLLPHHKPEAKLDCKGEPRALNEIADIKSCNGCLYLESRKKTRLYAWMGRPPVGPTVKFEVLNIHTMDELRLTGNCGLGTRPLLCFDRNFQAKAHWRLCKELLSLTFGSPRGHPKTKPFFDHALSFSIIDDAIWVRHFQITAATDGDDAKKFKDTDDLKLIEIGPRFVLAPVRILAGSFKGTTIFNDPNRLDASDDGPPKKPQQSLKKAAAAQKYQSRVRAKAQRKEHMAALALS